MNILYLLKGNDLQWRQQAACVGYDIFFPTRGEDTNAAKRICEPCPVRGKCLSLGLKEDHGIWGGTTLRQRRKIRRWVKKGLSLRHAVEKILHEKATWVEPEGITGEVRNIS